MHAGSAECSLDIIYHNERYSWDELCSQLDVIAKELDLALAVKTCARAKHSNRSIRALAVISRDRFSIALCLLHAFFNKRCCYPISPSQSEKYLSKLLVQSNVKLVIADNNMATSVKQVSLDNFLQNVTHSTSSDIDHSSYIVNSNELVLNCDCALLINTSGSVTEPKIVKLSYQNIFHHVQSFTQIIPLTSQSLWLNCLPLEHIAGAMILYRCLLTNAAMVLDNEFDEKKVWQEINAYSVTHLSLVPLMLKRILDYAEGASPPATLKYVLVGGDTIPQTLYQRAKQSGWPIILSYGMTEACSTIALGKTAKKLQLLAGIKKQINRKGELMIKGPMITSGYILGRNKTTTLKDNWFNTHDLVSSKGNCIQFTGRADNRIVSGGETIAPQLIEQLLSEFPGLDDVAVGKIIHPDWGNSIVALIQGDVDQLKSWVEEHLDKKYRPRFYLEHKMIPRNPSGKINRFEVQSIIKQRLAGLK